MNLSGTSGVLDNSGAFIAGTAVASTSGTSIDFTGIPSWVKRVTVMFSGVSTNGSSIIQIQIGSGSVTTTGYVSSGWLANVTQSNSTTGLLISGGNGSAYGQWGSATITLLGSNIYSFSSSTASGSSGSTSMSVGAGGITLSGTLDRVRITTVNGTDTFDAGSINILYE